jgi:type II secretory pathway component PulJ
MKNRRGFTVLETLVAGVLLAALLGLGAKMLQAQGRQQRVLRQRLVAAEELANLMERLTARPWPRLTAEAAADLQLSPEARLALPEARCDIQIIEQAKPVAGKRIAVVLHWPDHNGHSEQRVQLVAWKYRDSEAVEAGP